MTDQKIRFASIPVWVAFYPCPRMASGGPDKIGAQFIDAEGRYAEPTGMLNGVGNSREEALFGPMGLAAVADNLPSLEAQASRVITDALKRARSLDHVEFRQGDNHGESGARVPGHDPLVARAPVTQMDVQLAIYIAEADRVEKLIANRREAGEHIPPGANAACAEMRGAALEIKHVHDAKEMPVSQHPRAEAMLERVQRASRALEEVKIIVTQHDKATGKGGRN